MLGDFTQQAEAYRQARPTYPDALVDLLAGDARVKPGDAVADFGAGTGIFTQLLLDRGLRVTAIEPGEAMRQRQTAPGAHWVNGTFAASGLAARSQRWAVAAQAFHWADPATALPEIARILQANCLFTVVWNNRDVARSSLLRATEAIIRRHVPEFGEAYRDRPWSEVLESTGHFVFEKYRAAEHVVAMPRERYLNLWRSHNRLNTIAGPERFQAFLRELERELQATGADSIDVPYRCESWSARRC